MASDLTIGLVGFGEAGLAFAEGWKPLGLKISTYDVKLDDQHSADVISKRCQSAGVLVCHTIGETIGNADIVFSFVTADQAHVAAENCGSLGKKDSLYFDCNSCSPETKRKSAALLEDTGFRYVDAAVMAPVHPRLHQTPINICGDHCASAKEIADRLEMSVTAIDGPVGTTSSIKMIRSIMMKGFEAVMMECVLAGCKAGVDDQVLDSLDKTYPGFDFKQKAGYMMERVMVHGERRAAEMREVAQTLEELGMSNAMTTSTVDWQALIGGLKLDPNHSLKDHEYQKRADIILSALKEI